MCAPLCFIMTWFSMPNPIAFPAKDATGHTVYGDIGVHLRDTLNKHLIHSWHLKRSLTFITYWPIASKILRVIVEVNKTVYHCNLYTRSHSKLVATRVMKCGCFMSSMTLEVNFLNPIATKEPKKKNTSKCYKIAAHLRKPSGGRTFYIDPSYIIRAMERKWVFPEMVVPPNHPS